LSLERSLHTTCTATGVLSRDSRLSKEFYLAYVVRGCPRLLSRKQNPPLHWHSNSQTSPCVNFVGKGRTENFRVFVCTLFANAKTPKRNVDNVPQCNRKMTTKKQARVPSNGVLEPANVTTACPPSAHFRLQARQNRWLSPGVACASQPACWARAKGGVKE
jgi:hypothetical protein